LLLTAFIVLPHVVEGLLDEEDVATVKRGARRLIDATHEVAQEVVEREPKTNPPADLDPTPKQTPLQRLVHGPRSLVVSFSLARASIHLS
jgi:hypothetical protein